MKLNKNRETTILIIGLGVIGGGYAAALSEKGYTVKCITKEQSDVDYAMERGMIAYGTTEVEPELIREADLIVFALYPTVFIEWVERYRELFREGTLITDVSGVKSSVVRKVQDMLPAGVEFISAHPMAGRERSGVEFSDPAVFKGANYIVTPTEKNSLEEHDEMIAFLSQLTHCIAVTLMNCNETPELEKYTGDSFRDLTRIAKINDRMWAELFLMNKDSLLPEMDAFIKEFIEFRNMIENSDSDRMREKMRASTARRALFDKPKTN